MVWRLRKKILIGIIILMVFILVGLTYYYTDIMYYLKPAVQIEEFVSTSDKDKDGIADNLDILNGARIEIKNKPVYKSSYYKGGYPPKTEGVCTDVIWRSLKEAGFDLKEAIDKDIKNNPNDYKRVDKPDPNIDFRRVPNLHIFLKKYAIELTTEIKPYDKENLSQWQAGDIFISENQDHTGIISDKRRRDGVPYIIHNGGPVPKETDLLLYYDFFDKIVGHYRFPKEN